MHQNISGFLLNLTGAFGYFLIRSIILLSVSIPNFAQEKTSVNKLSIDQCLTVADEKEKSGDIREATRFINEAADKYWDAKNYDEAVKLYNRSITLNQKISNENGIAGINSNLGLIYFDKGEYEKSLDCFRKTYHYRHSQNEKPAAISALINMSVVLNKTKRYDEAVVVLDEAASTAREMNDLEQMRSCYGMLSETYTKAGNTTKAADYFYLYKTVHETLQRESEKRYREELEGANIQMQLAESRRQYADLELRYKQQELNEKEKALGNLDSANRVLLLDKTKAELLADNLKFREENAELMRKKAEAQLQNERLKNYVLFAGLGIALIGACVISFYYVQKRKINKRLEYQNAEIKKHRNKILEQNVALENAYERIRHINEDITQSIDYAEYIQKAFLSTPKDLKMRLPDSFVYMKACAIVSGDFFWCKHVNNKTLVACIDCTGHGVSGAFMSLIGSNLLTQIVDQGLTDPDQILTVLHIALFHALHKQDSKLHSGMDMALYCIDPDRKELTYAGAKIPLVYIRDGILYKISADKHAIGGDYFTYDENIDLTFRKHVIPLDYPICVYLSSDGYQSQLSHLDGKKFQSRRFRNLLLEIHEKPAEEQKNILESVMNEWLNGGEQVDDILVVGTKIDLTR